MSEEQTCPSCGTRDIASHPGHHKFKYGVDGSPDQVTLSAWYTGYTCNNQECGLGWADWRAEEARDRAVKNHLTRETSERFNEVARKHRLISIGEAEALYWEHQTVPMAKMLKKLNELQQDLDQTKELLSAKLQAECLTQKTLYRAQTARKRVSALLLKYQDRLDERDAVFVDPDTIVKELQAALRGSTADFLNTMVPQVEWKEDLNDPRTIRGTVVDR